MERLRAATDRLLGRPRFLGARQRLEPESQTFLPGQALDPPRALQLDLRERLRDTFRDALRDPLRERFLDALRERFRDTLRDALRERLRERLRDAFRDALRERLRDTLRDALRERLRDTLRETLRPLRDTLRPLRDTFRDAFLPPPCLRYNTPSCLRVLPCPLCAFTNFCQSDSLRRETRRLPLRDALRAMLLIANIIMAKIAKKF